MIALKVAEIKKFIENESEGFLLKLDAIGYTGENNDPLIKQLFSEIYSTGFDAGVKMAATIVKHAHDACVEKKE
jgi:hypothetical protein